jgi:hypothetical protein
MRRSLVIVASLVGAALVAGATTRGSPTSSDLDRPGTIRITSSTVLKNFINRGSPGRGPGDVVVSRQQLYNRSIRPAPIGHADFVCTFTAAYARLCTGTFTLPKGKIVVSGAATFRQFYELAVIGGTGLYDNVRGSMTVTQLHRRPIREFLYFRLVL